MAIGSALGDQLGITPESVYGTYVAPTRFPRGWLEGVPQFEPSRVQSQALISGMMVDPDDDYNELSRGGSGTIKLEVKDVQFGMILQHIFGGTITPVQQSATAAYLQTHPLADNAGKSLTIQAGVTDVGGTTRPYTFLGCKIKSAEFSNGIDEFLTVSLDIDFRDITEAQTLAAASYVAVRPFGFVDMGFKLGTFGAEAAVTGVKKVTLKIERPMDLGRKYANQAGLKAEPLWTSTAKVTGTIEADYVTKADFVDRFVNFTSTAMVWEHVGPIIASTFAKTFRLKVPRVRFTGESPNVSGQELSRISVPFEGKWDRTNNPITCEYMSTDVTV